MRKIILICVCVMLLVGCSQTKSIEEFYNLQSEDFVEMAISKTAKSTLTQPATGTYNGDEVYEYIKTMIPTKMKTVTSKDTFSGIKYTLVIQTEVTSYAIAVGEDYLQINASESGEIMYHAVDKETMSGLVEKLEEILRYFRF